MKKIKRAAGFLLALSFIVPSLVLAACHRDEGNALPMPETPPVSSEDTATPPAVEDDTPVVEPIIQKAQYLRCNSNSVNFRSGAGTEYAVLGQAHENEAYAVLEKKGNWYKTYYRGKVAYIYASYATVFTIEKSDDEKVENSIAEGYKLLGVPYVYGAVRLHDGKGNFLKGFSTQKFDCSSLVQYMFYHGAGKLLDVTTRTQVVQGKFVARANLKRGDCIYFTNESRDHLTGINRVGHVAVYLGDNYILHTASDYARIEKITVSRWKHYIETRRFT